MAVIINSITFNPSAPNISVNWNDPNPKMASIESPGGWSYNNWWDLVFLDAVDTEISRVLLIDANSIPGARNDAAVVPANTSKIVVKRMGSGEYEDGYFTFELETSNVILYPSGVTGGTPVASTLYMCLM